MKKFHPDDLSDSWYSLTLFKLGTLGHAQKNQLEQLINNLGGLDRHRYEAEARRVAQRLIELPAVERIVIVHHKEVPVQDYQKNEVRRLR